MASCQDSGMAPPVPVALLACDCYDREVIAERVASLVASLPAISSLHGRDVLLKPNLISTTGPALASTDADFIAGVALWLRGCGARVRLGDSPAFGSAAKVCRRHGIDTALAGLDVDIIEFATPVRRQLPCGESIVVAAEALETDLFINLPRIKAHNQMFVTLAVKNLFGIVKGARKAMLHMKQGGADAHDRFARIILELHTLLPTQLHIIDGIIAMSSSGPIDGVPLSLDILGASRSPVALDTALLELLGLDRQHSPLWRVASQLGLPGSKSLEICYPLDAPESFSLPPFSAPEVLNPVRFSLFRYLKGMVRRFVKA